MGSNYLDDDDEPEEPETDPARLLTHIRSDMSAFKQAWPFAVIPVVLVALLLQAAVGPFSGRAMILLPLGLVTAWLLVPFYHHWRSANIPIDVPGYGRLEGPAKRRAILRALPFVVGTASVALFGPPEWGWVRAVVGAVRGLVESLLPGW